MNRRRSDFARAPWGAVIGFCALSAGAAVLGATGGVVEAITAVVIVIAAGGVGMRWVRSLG